jgi:hypothetical protein
MMGKKLDLVGQRFGNWTVLRENGKFKNGAILWECKCDCGNISNVIGSHLKSRNSTSCGCITSKIDLSGQKFGKLVVLIENERNKHNRVVWRCKCDCGIYLNVTSQSLRSGNTKSCGKCSTNIFKYNEEKKYYEGYIINKNISKVNKQSYIDLSIFESDDIEISNDIVDIENLKQITTNRNPDFIFDKSCYNDIKNHCWSMHKHRHNEIKTSLHHGNGTKEPITLQRFIIKLLDTVKLSSETRVTFKSNPNFDFRYENLIFTSRKLINQKKVNHNKYGYKGVFKTYNRYQSKISYNKKNIYIGNFETPESAALAYNQKALELYGKNAYQNKISKPKSKPKQQIQQESQ